MLTQFQLLKSDMPLKQSIIGDFSTLLRQIGLRETEAQNILKKFLFLLDEDISQSTFENEFRRFVFSLEIIDKSFMDLFQDMQVSRSNRIYSEVVDFVKTKNKVLDFGCGNGLVAQLLSDKNNVQVEGCDVVAYVLPNVKVPIHKFNGYHLDVADGYFEIGYANSVLHHDEEPDKVIGEITRVVTKRFILIEDTVQGSNTDERDFHSKRLFINDYIYNRLLTDGDVPVPGKYRVAADWIKAFSALGWKLSSHSELGWSKILPAVFRERFVFERAQD